MISIKIGGAFVLLIIIYLASLSFITRHDRIKAENERQLTPCPDKPNCVYSQSKQKAHTIDAFSILDKNKPKSWNKLASVIQQSGGKILIDDGQYIHAVFTSSIFRFKDDFEAKLNETQIDIRCASRAGTSDLGQNRKRVEKLRLLYKAALSQLQ